jgi:uncharacterized membrane protein YcaP (DUF421 family)
MEWFGADWETVFITEIPVVEIVVRSTVLYFVVFLIMRGTLRRTAGQLSMLDFIFVLLVANGAADAMTGGATSIMSGVIIVLTVVAWNYILNSLSYRIPMLERLVSPPPLRIVDKGKMLRRNMRQEFLTEQELMAQLREEGIEDLSKVKAAHIEGDGNISVITYDD